MITTSKNRNSQIVLLLSFVPFIGLWYSLSHWREKWAMNAFWVACIYLGAVFIFCPEGTVLGMGADGSRVALRLMEWYKTSKSINDVFTTALIEERSVDYYELLITFIVSRFTDNGHVLFTVFAFVFGFFYSRNIWYVLDRLPQKKLGNIVVLVALLFLACPITQINAVRMWTALHVFVYAMMPYLLDRDKSRLWCLVLVPLIHFSYLYVCLLAIAYVMASGRFFAKSSFIQLIALLFFVVTMFINAINLDAVGGMMSEISPESFEGRIDIYVNQDLMDKNKESSALNNWYLSLSSLIQSWSFNILLILLFPCFKRNVKQKELFSSLYLFALLLGAFANIMALIPSGGRFLLLSKMFFLPLIILVVMTIPQSDSYKKYVNVALLFLILPLVVEFRRLFDYFSITAIVGNFITVLLWENNIPLIDFIKQLV